MSKKNIYFSILNYDLSSRVYLPYVYGTLRSYCDTIPPIAENYHWNNPFFRLNTTPIKDIANTIKNPEILALSCNVWNIKKQLKLAKIVKTNYPNCLVVLGGPESPRDANVFLKSHQYIDITVQAGEGELPFSQILLENLKTKDWSKVKGISYRDCHDIKKTQKQERIQNLEDIPSPYLRGYLDFALEEIKRDHLVVAAVLETNRGCPYSCTFCDWGSNTMSRIRTFNLQKIKDEITWFGENKVDEIMFADANVGILPRDLEITEKLAEVNKLTGFPKKAHITFAKNTNEKVMKIATLLAENRICHGISLSVQSMDQATLDTVARTNIKLQNNKDLITAFNQKNIPIYSDVILGLPQESKESFTKGIGELLNLGVHTGITPYSLSILENSQMNDPEYKRRLGITSVSRPFWPSFPFEEDDCIDRVDIVVATNTLSKQDWVWCKVFLDLVQSLHMGGWTRYLAIYLNDNDLISYKDFYTRLTNYFLSQKKSLAGGALNKVQDKYQDFLVNENIHQEVWSDFEILYKEKVYKMHGTPFHLTWSTIASDRRKFYSEIYTFIMEELKLDLNTLLLSELLKFQDEFVLSPDYDGAKGKKAVFEFNFAHYFFDKLPLKKERTQINFFDKHTGLGNIHQLVKTDDFKKYIINATGLNIRHAYYYLHQIDRCESKPLNNITPHFFYRLIDKFIN